MNISKNEERLYQWAIKNKNDSGLKEKQTSASYWNIRDDSKDGIIEYHVETIKEMQEYLANAGIEKELALIFSAEAIKWKIQYFKSREEELNYKEVELPRINGIPEYVYTF